MRVVRTGNLIYAGHDRVDISPQSSEMPGRAFAPSWALRSDALDWRLGGGDNRQGWESFSARYLEEVSATLAHDPSLLDRLLAHDTVTLVCSCARPDRCHRVLLAKLLAERGVRYEGELAIPYTSMIEEPPTEVSRVRAGTPRMPASSHATLSREAITGTAGGRGEGEG